MNTYIRVPWWATLTLVLPSCSGSDNPESAKTGTHGDVAIEGMTGPEHQLAPSVERVSRQLFEGISWSDYGLRPPVVTELGPIPVVRGSAVYPRPVAPSGDPGAEREAIDVGGVPSSRP